MAVVGSSDCSATVSLLLLLTYPYYCMLLSQQTQQAEHQHNMFFSLSTLLQALAASAASIPFVAAQASETELTTNDLYAKIAPDAAPPGFNVDGGSVFTNFVNAVNDGQFFQVRQYGIVYEKPDSEPIVENAVVYWCSDLTFSDFSNSSLMGYAARCVEKYLAGYAEAVASGAQLTYSEGLFGGTLGISAVFAEQLNVFEGQYHANTDDWSSRYWDDGRKTMPRIGWEGHDEGDMSVNAATASWSLFGEITWMTVEEVAQLLNTSTDEFTPTNFQQVYEDTWINEHKNEAATQNPNPGAELEIVEEVENEKGAAENSPVDDGSGGRKLVAATARFLSAALRVFAI